MKVLFIFLDGVGLGTDDPSVNPFTRANMPVLSSLLGGQRLSAGFAPFESKSATLLALDASLGVDGFPQSATGQAALLTGLNVPGLLGEHYGPKPNQQIADIIKADNIFIRLSTAGKKTALLNAYPPRYFHSLNSGRRLMSAIPLAVASAGIPLFTKEDFYNQAAMSADFTGAGWRSMLGYDDAPVLSAREGGELLASLAQQYDFSMFEYWASDYAGHEQDMDKAVDLLESFDQVLEGLLSLWDNEVGLLLITSDHGNMEDLSTRRHTLAEVPAILIGKEHSSFGKGLQDIAGVAHKIEQAVLTKR